MRLRWLSERWLALAAMVLVTPIVIITAIGTLYWPGRVFPGFFAMGNAVVPTMGLYDWTGMRAGVPFHARVVAADGHDVRTSADLYAYVAELPADTPVQYELVKDDHRLSRVVQTMRFGGYDYWLTVGMYLVMGLLSAGAGIVVAVLQPRTAAARAFLGQGVLTGLFALTGTALYHPDLWWLSRFHFVTQTLSPAAFIHLGLTFPVERPLVQRQPLWLLLPYAIAIPLIAWIFSGFYASPPDTTPLYAAYLYTAVAIGVLLILVSYAYWENRTPFVRPRLHIVLPGLVLGLGLAFYGFLNTSRSGGNFPINFIAVGPAAFYLSIAYAIAKHDLFDIDAFVKQAAVYVTLTLVITAAYVASVVVLGRLLPPHVLQLSPAFNIAFVVLIAMVLQPLRTGVQHVVDRTFYRSRPDFRRTVSEVSGALTSLLDLNEILDRVGRALTEGFQLRSLSVILWSDDDTKVWRYKHSAQHVEEAGDAGCAALRSELEREPGRPWRLREADVVEAGAHTTADGTVSCARAMMRLDAALLVPLTAGARVIGALALGPKRPGRTFSREDLSLLDTVAAQCAIAVQNARSYRALQTLNEELDAKVQTRTAELRTANVDLEAFNKELERAYRELQATQTQLVQTEKMASLGLLVAGVAHEINNPVSFIVSNVTPLRKRLMALRELAAGHPDAALTTAVDRVVEVFDVIARGAERTAGIVQDLRSFSRPGETEAKLIDLHEGIDVSIRLLRPRWVDRITIHRDYGELPAVEATPSQVNQVFMNILANACDAIMGRGNLWIRTECNGSQVKVRIRDDGIGIPPEQLGRIFDPFFTTKPVGKGTGLGLAISHGLIAHHGGTIQVRSAPGEGTEFTIVLPVRSVAAAS